MMMARPCLTEPPNDMTPAGGWAQKVGEHYGNADMGKKIEEALKNAPNGAIFCVGQLKLLRRPDVLHLLSHGGVLQPEMIISAIEPLLDYSEQRIVERQVIADVRFDA